MIFSTLQNILQFQTKKLKMILKAMAKQNGRPLPLTDDCIMQSISLVVSVIMLTIITTIVFFKFILFFSSSPFPHPPDIHVIVFFTYFFNNFFEIQTKHVFALFSFSPSHYHSFFFSSLSSSFFLPIMIFPSIHFFLFFSL